MITLDWSTSGDPLQFMCHSNCSTADTISHTLRISLSPTPTLQCCSSNSVHHSVRHSPAATRKKLPTGHQHNYQYLDSGLPDRETTVRVYQQPNINNHQTEHRFLPGLLFMLLSRKSKSNHLIKFTDETSVMGLISSSNEGCYKEEVAQLVSWCNNILYLKVDKTEGMVNIGGILVLYGCKSEEVTCILLTSHQQLK